MLTMITRILKTLAAILIFSALLSLTATAQQFNQNVQYTKLASYTGRPEVKDTSFWMVNGTDTLRITTYGDTVRFISTAAAYKFTPELPTGNSAWALTGNSGTTPGTNFIGTTDSKDLYFKTKNTTAIVIDTNQKVGIGTTTPSLGLEIQGKGFATQSIDMFGFSEITHYSPGHVIVIQNYGSQNYLGSAIAMDTFGVFSLSSKRVNISANDTLNLSISGTEATGYVLTSDASGNARWSPTAFTPADSVTIYALIPDNGTTYYCTDCSGNGITGRIVSFFGAAWRRQLFE